MVGYDIIIEDEDDVAEGYNHEENLRKTVEKANILILVVVKNGE